MPSRNGGGEGRSSRRHAAQPAYELRVRNGKGGRRIEIWQLPSRATPRLEAPEVLATMGGTALRLMESRLSRRLARIKVSLNDSNGKKSTWRVEEDLAQSLGLMFRALAPMTNLDRILEVADGMDAMSHEEASYWLGMALHRENPRRVLAALRVLLTSV